MPNYMDVNYEDFQPSHQARQDETLLVKFYTKSVQDRERSERRGRPVFREVEYIDITVPGQRNSVRRPATHRDKQRFPRHYQAFKQRIEIPEEGTPLAEWGLISRSTADMLAFSNVKTVEQLAEVPDNIITDFMNGLSLKQKAKDFLQRTKNDVTIGQLEEALRERDDKLSALMERLEELEKAHADKPKRTRKRRTEPSSGGSGAGPDSGPVGE